MLKDRDLRITTFEKDEGGKIMTMLHLPSKISVTKSGWSTVMLMASLKTELREKLSSNVN